MKPSKNKYYCPDSRRNKMLFDSKEEADRFIEHNGQDVFEVGGRRLTRSYYCTACAGWHLTSSTSAPYKSQFEMRLEKEISTEVADEIDYLCEDELGIQELTEEGKAFLERRLANLFVRMEREVWMSKERVRVSISKFVNTLNRYRGIHLADDPDFKRRMTKRIKQFAERYCVDIDLYVKLVNPDSLQPYKTYFNNKLSLLKPSRWQSKEQLHDALRRLIDDFQYFIDNYPGEEDYKQKLCAIIMKRAHRLGVL